MFILDRNSKQGRAATAVANDAVGVVPMTTTTTTTFAAQTSRLIPADVRIISVSHTVLSSVDAAAAFDGGLPDPVNRMSGVCTAALLELWYAAARTKQQGWSWQDMLVALREKLESQGIDQIPQLTSSKPLNIPKTPFTLGNKAGGNKRALLVGINYTGQEGQLRGCHHDVYSVQQYLTSVEGYPSRNIILLADDGKHVSPTRHEITRSLQKLVLESRPGDSLYFHYCGHGGLLFPEANDFKKKYKGYDETLYPLDHAHAGQILDQSLYRNLVAPLKAGVTLTAVIDCCHSGSVLELPYTFAPNLSATSSTTTSSRGIVQMRENLDALANLTFLHVLLGRTLPPSGFDNVVTHIESKTGNAVREYQGIGLALEDHQGVSENENITSHANLSNGFQRDIFVDRVKDADSSRADNECIGGMCCIL